MSENHLSEETLAALAEGQETADLGPGVREHLLECRTCHAAYAEAVRLRAQWLDQPEAFVPEESSIAEGLAVAHGRSRSARTAARRLPLFLRPLPATAAGTLLLAAMLVLVFLSPVWNRSGSVLEMEVSLIQPVVAALSSQGLVLPGGEDGPTNQVAYRAGADLRDDVVTAIGAVTEAYEGGDTSAETSYWVVAGRLAAGQLQHARVVAAEARRAYPRDIRLIIAQAVLAYRESNLPLADELLAEALAIDPHDPAAAFNRGLVLLELGRPEEARSHLQAVAMRQADRSIGQRASELLLALDQE